MILVTDEMNYILSKKYLQWKFSRSTEGNVFDDYIQVINKQLDKAILRESVEVILEKLIKVCNILQPSPELSDENVAQYESMAELLNSCCKVGVENSQLVTSLLRLTVDRCSIAPLNPLYARQPSYPANFLQYILEQARKEKFDLEGYCFRHPRTLWEYSRNVSVSNAVSCGDGERVLTLLQYGVDVVPDLKLKKRCQRYSRRYQSMPRRLFMVFRMMNSIRSANFLLLDSVTNPSKQHRLVSEPQKECFHIVWRSTSEPHVRREELLAALDIEHASATRRDTPNSSVTYKNKRKLCDMYEKHFSDLASGSREPRDLKHLCRCAIRKRVKETWGLPHDIFRLPLPKFLQRYVNLEMD